MRRIKSAILNFFNTREMSAGGDYIYSIVNRKTLILFDFYKRYAAKK